MMGLFLIFDINFYFKSKVAGQKARHLLPAFFVKNLKSFFSLATEICRIVSKSAPLLLLYSFSTPLRLPLLRPFWHKEISQRSA